MFVVSGGKGTGKTKNLLLQAKAEDGIILCEDPNALRVRAYSYGITGLNILPYNEILGDGFDKPVLYMTLTNLCPVFSRKSRVIP